MAQVVLPVATLTCSPEFDAHSVSTGCYAYCQVGLRDLTYRPSTQVEFSEGRARGEGYAPILSDSAAGGKGR